MCGICGKINFNKSDKVDIDAGLIKNMVFSLTHRGPDDNSIYIHNNIGLGHCRLSIIDLSSHARQPMCNEDGKVWIVFNGEIYNFHDLKKDLIKKGHVFRSNSDTEVILHLYEEEGPECVKKLRGMFAFVIWDDRNKSLVLARDRVGKKPLFYYLTDNCLIFASEIKAILQDPIVNKKPDHIAIHHYLTYQSVPSPFSAFEGIKKIPSAHYSVFKDGKLETKRYWKLLYNPKFPVKNLSDQRELEAELLDRFKDAVKIRLISDVPLGAFLSGGVDSSVVVALMSQLMQEPVKTFSIGFHEEQYDELKYARIIADQFKTDHTEFKVKPDAVDVLPKLVWYYNDPFADPSAIPSYYVSKLAREHVTVALNGDGGDENFAGYERYRANELAMAFHWLPASIRNGLSHAVSTLLPASADPNSFLWKLKRFSQALVKSPELRNADWLCQFNNQMKEGLYTGDFQSATKGFDSFDVILEKYADSDAESFLDRTLYADVMLYLTDTLLVKMDIASMANSLEARSPFLDHELMEFVAKIPADLKLSNGNTKIILKNTFSHILPKKILNRKKMGFAVPLDHWFRNELKEMAYDLLLGQKCTERGYFNRNYIKQMLDEHSSGKWNWHHQIYNLLMLELWHEIFIDEPNVNSCP